MSTNIVNQVAYLRTSREFPKELSQLTVEVNKSYVDIANAINSRTIGLFPTGRPAITGESWFINSSRRQQTLRQVYTFTTTNPIPHGINFTTIDRFTRMYGQYTDGTNWYGMPATTNVAILGQFTFYVDPMNIVFPALGAGAPAIQSGNIVLEWLSKV